MEYFTRQFTEPQNDLEGLNSSGTPLGLAVTADTSAMGRLTKIVLLFTSCIKVTIFVGINV